MAAAPPWAPSSPWLSLPPPAPDDSVSTSKTPWGISIIKKNKKAAPRAFGVRLEECQPATENQVGSCRAPGPEGSGETEAQRLRAARDLGTSSPPHLMDTAGEAAQGGSTELSQSP